MHAVAQTHFFKGILCSRFGFKRRHAREFEGHGNVVEGRQVVQQVKVLKDPAHELSTNIDDA